MVGNDALLSVFLCGPRLASDGVIPVLIEVSPLAIRRPEKLNVDAGSPLAGKPLRKRRRSTLGQLDLVAKRRGRAAGLGNGIHARATARRAIGASCGGLGFGLGLAAETTKGLCCFVFHGGGGGGLVDGADKGIVSADICAGQSVPAIGRLGSLSADKIVILSEHPAEIVDALVVSPKRDGEDGLADKGIARIAGVGVDAGGFGEVCCHGQLRLVDTHKIPNRLGLSRKDLNYFHGPKSGSFSPLNAKTEGPPTGTSTKTNQ